MKEKVDKLVSSWFDCIMNNRKEKYKSLFYQENYSEDEKEYFQMLSEAFSEIPNRDEYIFDKKVDKFIIKDRRLKIYFHFSIKTNFEGKVVCCDAKKYILEAKNKSNSLKIINIEEETSFYNWQLRKLKSKKNKYGKLFWDNKTDSDIDVVNELFVAAIKPLKNYFKKSLLEDIKLIIFSSYEEANKFDHLIIDKNFQQVNNGKGRCIGDFIVIIEKGINNNVKSKKNMIRLIRHELSHLILNRLLKEKKGNHLNGVLNEAFAKLGETLFDFSNFHSFDFYKKEIQKYPRKIEELNEYDMNSMDKMCKRILLGISFLDYILKEYGFNDMMTFIIDAFNMSINEALESRFSESREVFEERWDKYVKSFS